VIPDRVACGPLRAWFFSQETKRLTIHTKIGQIPRHIVRDMHAPEILDIKGFCKLEGILVIHVLVYMIFGRNQRIHKQEVHTFQKIESSFRKIDPRIRSKSDPVTVSLYEQSAGVGGRVIYLDKGECQAGQEEGLVRFLVMAHKRQESKNTPAIIHDRRGGENIRDFLHAVKFSKAHKMVIVTMSPYYRRDVRGTIQQELLAQIRGTIHQDMSSLSLDEERCP
jgi:hypothetical protein